MNTEIQQQQKTDLSRYNSSWYKPGNVFLQVCWYFTNVLFFINPLNPFNGLKIFLLRLFGAKIGKGVVIKPGVNIKYPWKLKIGNYTWIGERVWIDNLGEVSIGNNCCISQGAMLLCGNHNYSKATFDLIVKPIVLEDGAWMGARSLAGPGTVMGTHSILTVLSVATGHLPPYSICKGNPATVVRERNIQTDK